MAYSIYEGSKRVANKRYRRLIWQKLILPLGLWSLRRLGILSSSIGLRLNAKLLTISRCHSQQNIRCVTLKHPSRQGLKVFLFLLVELVSSFQYTAPTVPTTASSKSSYRGQDILQKAVQVILRRNFAGAGCGPIILVKLWALPFEGFWYFCHCCLNPPVMLGDYFLALDGYPKGGFGLNDTNAWLHIWPWRLSLTLNPTIALKW